MQSRISTLNSLRCWSQKQEGEWAERVTLDIKRVCVCVNVCVHVYMYLFYIYLHWRILKKVNKNFYIYFFISLDIFNQYTLRKNISLGFPSSPLYLRFSRTLQSEAHRKKVYYALKESFPILSVQKEATETSAK